MNNSDMKNIICVFSLVALFLISFVFANGLGLLNKNITTEQISLIKEDLNNIEYVKKIIHQMYQVDQNLRQEFIRNSNNLKIQSLIKEMDKSNTEKMKEILLIHGWINISKFGKEADHEAWLLVHHADHDPFFQGGCVFLLSNLIERGETDKKNYAYLYDRVALKFQGLGMKQKYGTQVSLLENEEVFLLPYEGSMQELDSHRRQIGLEPIKQYLETIKKFYKK